MNDSRVRRHPSLRAARSAILIAVVALTLTGCGFIPDRVTDCDTSGDPATCDRDQRFDLDGASIVVDELENVAGPEDHAHINADITIDGQPHGDLQAQLHVVDSLTEEDLVVDPDDASALAEEGSSTITWDFSDQGFAQRIQFDRFPPNVFITFSDGDQQVVVTVMSVEYD